VREDEAGATCAVGVERQPPCHVHVLCCGGRGVLVCMSAVVTAPRLLLADCHLTQRWCGDSLYVRPHWRHVPVLAD
jgi:hypothetical protein